MLKTLRALAVVSLASLAVLAGCATPADGDDSTATNAKADGLSVIVADEAAGKLVATFRKDGREIRFDMRLGEKMELPDPNAEALGLPTHMNDVQILDSEGRPFFMQMGADSFIDPSWRMPKVENIDEAGRFADFDLARDAESAWAAATLPAWAGDLRLSAIDLARGIDAMKVKDGEPVKTAPSGGPGTLETKETVYWGSSSTAKWDYKIFEKDAFINGSPFDHSAVMLRGWSSSSSLLFSASSCNHGTCADSTAMQRSCTMTGFRTDDGTHSRYFYRETSTSTSVSSGCSTAYGALFDNYKHVCNDDSLIQRDAIYYDSAQGTSSGTCADTTKNYWGPGCQ